jgi:hypothetical protein
MRAPAEITEANHSCHSFGDCRRSWGAAVISAAAIAIPGRTGSVDEPRQRVDKALHERLNRLGGAASKVPWGDSVKHDRARTVAVHLDITEGDLGSAQDRDSLRMTVARGVKEHVFDQIAVPEPLLQSVPPQGDRRPDIHAGDLVGSLIRGECREARPLLDTGTRDLLAHTTIIVPEAEATVGLASSFAPTLSGVDRAELGAQMFENTGRRRCREVRRVSRVLARRSWVGESGELSAFLQRSRKVVPGTGGRMGAAPRRNSHESHRAGPAR